MKLRRIKYFEELTGDIQERVKLSYPTGGRRQMISVKQKDGHLVKGLPLETENCFYVVIMDDKPQPKIEKKSIYRFRPTLEDIREMEDDDIDLF